MQTGGETTTGRDRHRGLTTVALVASLAVLSVPNATAKDFKPGDVKLCGVGKCAAIMDPATTNALESLIYTGGSPQRVGAPHLGAAYFKLRFDNRYVPGIVAARRLDRFLSYGVVLERFRRGSWYRVPPAGARGLRILSAGLRPFRLTPAAVGKSR